METKDNFYAQEIGKCDLKELLEQDNGEEVKEEIKTVGNPITINFNALELKDNGWLDSKKYIFNLLNSNDVISSFFDYLKSGCSFLRAYTYLRQINSYLEKDSSEVKRLKEKWEKEGVYIDRCILNRELEDYLELLSKAEEEREFDIGDRVKISYIKIENPRACFDYYSEERDKMFPRGSIGTIISINKRGCPTVYFNKKTDYEPDVDGKNADENLRKSIKEWFEIADHRKNTAYYNRKELIFVPINKIETSKMQKEVNRLEQILTKDDGEEK